MPTITSSSSPARPDLGWSTAELLWAAGRGDPSAWEEIVRRYGRLVATTVGSFRLQEADKLDAVQMTWLRLVENSHRVQNPERLDGWLITTARRECLRILRAKHAAAPSEAVADTATPAAGPEEHVLAAETAQELRTMLAELPSRRRGLLRALFAEDASSYLDVARATGIPIGSIGPTRARALRQLRRMLRDRDLIPGSSTMTTTTKGPGRGSSTSGGAARIPARAGVVGGGGLHGDAPGPGKIIPGLRPSRARGRVKSYAA